MGGKGSSGTAAVIATYAGGYNGGGNGYVNRAGYTQTAASGGGATDVRLVGGSWNSTQSLISRIMVAAGGGGAYTENVSTSDNAYIYGGAGGTLYGESAIYRSYAGYSSLNPTGGTQINGGQGLNSWTATSYVADYTGTFGKGATGGNSYSGGGGGYYGGASGVWQPGAGGSSYISGYAGVNSVEENTTITHTNQTLHYSGKYFVGGKMLKGFNEGNGYAKITYVDEKPKRKNKKLNNVRYIKDCTNYNSRNSANHWVEIQVIKDGVNIAKGKTIPGTTTANPSYPYSAAVDGSIVSNGAGTYGTPSTATNNQCVIIDLGDVYNIDEIMVINSNIDQRSYYDAITYVSSNNNVWEEIINEAYIDSANGRRANAYIDTYSGYAQDNLVLWYDAYANNGGTRTHNPTTWKDLSGTGNNGTIKGGTWYPNYVYMDGIDDYVTTPYNATLAPNEFTIDLTFNKDTVVNNARSILFVKWQGYTIELNPDNSVVFGTSLAGTTSNYLSGGTIELDKTYHIVATYKDKVEKIYINGVLKNSRATPTGTFTHSAVDLSIGRYSTSNYSNVRLMQAKLYSRALSDDEIKHNYLHDKDTIYALNLD